MQNDIISLIIRLTPSKPEMETLQTDILQSFKQILRSDPSLNIPVFSFIQQRASHQSAQVRFLLFQLVNYIFCRSSHFRSLFCRSYIQPFMQNFTTNVPPPERTANKLRKIIRIAIPQWVEKYGHIYKQLNVLSKELIPKQTKEEKIKINQAEYINGLADSFLNHYNVFFTEMSNLIDLMDKNKSDFIVPSDEYVQIVLEQIKERKNQLEKCERDVNKLKMKMILYHVEDDVKDKVLKLYERFVTIQEAARQIGAYDDEFEDVESDADENDD